MALSKYKLGELIRLEDERNSQERYTLDVVRGISTNKEFIETKADMDGVNLSTYKVVSFQEFAYVADTSRRGDKIAVAFNNCSQSILVSSIYTVFCVKRKDVLLSDYLYMYFNRPEFDRYARFNSWGSAREVFSWEDLCDIELELPDLDTQQKYVDIYLAMVDNQKAYERGLSDLKLSCDGYIEDLRRKMPSEKIGNYLVKHSEKNTDKTIDQVVGLSTKKEFREAQERVNRDELGGYKILHPLDVAFVPTTDTWKVLAFAVNHFDKDVVVSPIYEVFSVDNSCLMADYLAMWLKREEFDRYARFHSWGSARENFTFDDMCEVKIPIPDIKVQKAITDVYKVYIQRKEINEKLKSRIKSICPILIKGSLEEGR